MSLFIISRQHWMPEFGLSHLVTPFFLVNVVFNGINQWKCTCKCPNMRLGFQFLQNQMTSCKTLDTQGWALLSNGNHIRIKAFTTKCLLFGFHEANEGP